MASPNDIALFGVGVDGNNIRLGRAVGGGVITWAVPGPGALALAGGAAPARAVSRAVPTPGALALAGLTPGRTVTRAVPAADDLDLSGLTPTASGWTAGSTAPARRWRGARRR